VHFLVFERGFKWLFEGEDRNRHFFWSTAPFYGRQVFTRAMRCPANLKANYLVYRLFMEALGPSLVDVESTTVGPSLRFWRNPFTQAARRLRRRIGHLTRLAVRGRPAPPADPSLSREFLTCLREQLASSAAVASYLSVPRLTPSLEHIGLTQLHMLFTVTSAIEYFTTGKSTLERYQDTLF